MVLARLYMQNSKNLEMDSFFPFPFNKANLWNEGLAHIHQSETRDDKINYEKEGSIGGECVGCPVDSIGSPHNLVSFVSLRTEE